MTHSFDLLNRFGNIIDREFFVQTIGTKNFSFQFHAIRHSNISTNRFVGISHARVNIKA
jgi:hypothetical protein